MIVATFLGFGAVAARRNSYRGRFGPRNRRQSKLHAASPAGLVVGDIPTDTSASHKPSRRVVGIVLGPDPGDVSYEYRRSRYRVHRFESCLSLNQPAGRRSCDSVPLPGRACAAGSAAQATPRTGGRGPAGRILARKHEAAGGIGAPSQFGFPVPAGHPRRFADELASGEPNAGGDRSPLAEPLSSPRNGWASAPGQTWLALQRSGGGSRSASGAPLIAEIGTHAAPGNGPHDG